MQHNSRHFLALFKVDASVRTCKTNKYEILHICYPDLSFLLEYAALLLGTSLSQPAAFDVRFSLRFNINE